MRKVILKITETLKYQREVPVEVPDFLSENDLNHALDHAQRSAESIDDMVIELRRYGINQTASYDRDLDSPWDVEIECDDYEWISDEEETE